jgi:hypothetical protein
MGTIVQYAIPKTASKVPISISGEFSILGRIRLALACALPVFREKTVDRFAIVTHYKFSPTMVVLARPIA